MSQQQESILYSYLPQNGGIYGWNRQYLPELYRSTNLYNLIDGQATVYFEYGFSEAIVCDYINTDKEVIHVEIYEMKDAAACYGIYTFSLAENGQSLEIGDEGAYYDLYLIFRKGRYFVTITSGNDNVKVHKAIMQFGNRLSSLIPDKGNVPAITNIISKPAEPMGRFIYLKGPLALRKIYPFSSEDQFKFKEGVAGNFDSIHIIALKYEDILNCRTAFSNISKIFKKLPSKYKLVVDRESSISFIDNKENYLFFKNFENFMFILISHRKMNDDEADQIIFRNIEKRIMVDLLPGIPELNAAIDNIEYYYRDELYYAIDGGADIFYEYGFDCMLSVKYRFNNVKEFIIPVEIYKMDDPQAAAGIFSMMNKDGLHQMNNNDTLTVEDCRMKYRNNYFFLITSNDTSAEVRIWSDLILKKIFENIGKDTRLTPETEKLAQSVMPGEKIRIIRGNIALNNIYQFGQKLISGFELAFASLTDSSTYVILEYSSKDSAIAHISSIEKKISSNAKFNNYTKKDKHFLVADKKGNSIIFSRFKNYIFVLISREKNINMNVVDKIRFRIN